MAGGGRVITGEEKKRIASLCQEELKLLTGKGPSRIIVTAAPDLINIRSDGFLTQFEKELLKCENGDQIVIALRRKLFDNVKADFYKKFSCIVDAKIRKVFEDYLPYENSQNFSILY